MTCEYCRNRSGLMDERGQCISCGAPMENADALRPLVRINGAGEVVKWEDEKTPLQMFKDIYAWNMKADE